MVVKVTIEVCSVHLFVRAVLIAFQVFREKGGKGGKGDGFIFPNKDPHQASVLALYPTWSDKLTNDTALCFD